VLQILYIFISETSLKTSGEFSLNLAENYKSRHNTANPNIGRVFGPAGFIIFLTRPGSLVCDVPSTEGRPPCLSVQHLSLSAARNDDIHPTSASRSSSVKDASTGGHSITIHDTLLSRCHTCDFIAQLVVQLCRAKKIATSFTAHIA